MTPPTSDNEKLCKIITLLIQKTEVDLEYALSTPDYVFLHNTMQVLIPEMIHKFIAGGKEHNPDHDCNFVETVPHLIEIQKENIDGIFYGRAIQQLITARNGAK